MSHAISYLAQKVNADKTVTVQFIETKLHIIKINIKSQRIDKSHTAAL